MKVRDVMHPGGALVAPETPLSQKISIPGFTQLASSSVPAMIIVTFGMTSASSINADPHSGQKRR